MTTSSLGSVSKARSRWRYSLTPVSALPLALAAIAGSLTPISASRAATYKTIYDLPGVASDLNGVEDTLAADSAGRLYGTRTGQSGYGFVLIPHAGGAHWSENTFFSFFPFTRTTPSNAEGGFTLAYNTILGSTTAGGVGYGVAYRIDNKASPTLTQLHTFLGDQSSPPDGAQPLSGLTVGLGGYLYGTTPTGTKAPATVFAMNASATAPQYQVIHRFGAKGDGAAPFHGRLWADSQGRLFGTTEVGGANGQGTVFMLQFSGGRWHEQVIYSFQATNDVRLPVANVVLDTQGNVYGCAQLGAYGQGGIFRLTPPQQEGAAWAETVLYYFGAAPMDPVAANTDGNEGCGITIDPATNIIYGTSYGGGAKGDGTIFSLAPPAAGQTAWTETIIHSFTDINYDGKNPVAPPLKVGNTYYGGNLSGVIYSFQP